jgi:NRAMP (natural resistance-associated macrophage protein)-like metal ion transporter
MILLSVIGPGIITASVDNDAGGIATYAIAGAQEGYGLLWVLVIITFNLAIIQEMAARMGAVTGQGLTDLIRERFGVKVTMVTLLLLIMANLTTTVAEFAGVAAAMELFGVSKYLSVPAAALIVWLLVVKGNYMQVERILLIGCIIYFTYVISGFMANPPWGDVLKSLVTPTVKFTPSYMNLFIALIGTTITPWMQFYLQSSIVDKGIDMEHFRYTRIDVYLGSFVTDFIAFFIIVATAATLFPHGIMIETAADAAKALEPLAGEFAEMLFALGLLNASILGALILPLSTAYAVTESLGWESGVSRTFKEAPQFLGLYTFIIIIGAGAIMMPGLPLMKIMLFSQTVNGMLLPVVLILMLKLINDRRIMGEHVNSRGRNIVAWSTAIALILATLGLLVSPFFQ